MADIERVRFAGHEGELAARLHHPEGEPAGGVVLAHCFTCGKDIATMTRLARGLAAAGYAALRVDLSGLGESEGDFARTTLTTDVADLTAAARWLAGRVDAPLVLLGHSMGGAAAVLAAEGLPEVRAVAVLAAPSQPAHLGRNLPPLEATRERDVEVEIAGQRVVLGEGLLDDLESHDVRGAAASLDRPLLVLHGTADALVAVEEGEALAAVAPDATLVRIEGGDHLLTRREHAREAVDALVGWLDEVLAGS